MSKKRKSKGKSTAVEKIKNAGPIILATLLADQITKITILYTLAKNQVVYVFPFFNFTLTYNTGVSFGMFQSNGMLGYWLLILIAVSLCGYLGSLIYQTKERFEEQIYSLIIGGAIGNLLDRFFYGGVVDFLQFHLKHHYWPSFNIADSAIVSGVVLVLAKQTWHSLKNKTK